MHVRSLAGPALGMLATAVLACSSAASSNGFSGNQGGAGGGAGLGLGGDGGGDLDSGLDVAPGDGPGPSTVAEVWGHSADTLYRLDPLTKAVTVIGPFVGCTQVIDIALDKSSSMYATTMPGFGGGLYSIDKANAHCTLIQSGDYPNSLSFVPAGTVDPNVEALVGYNGSTYVRIDTASGAVTTIGGLTNGDTSSGDIVSVIGGSTYLTVTGFGSGDNLVEVNPTTGDLVKDWGSVGYGSVYGLAFWAGAAYGFTSDGILFEIDFSGTQVQTTPITVPNPPPGLSFWGAGSTTAAPVKPVN